MIPTYKFDRDDREAFKADIRVWELLDVIAAEFESDPMSTQCFDLRIVEEVKALVKRRKKLRDSFNPFEAIKQGLVNDRG